MSAYIVLVLAALSRCLPHWMHSSGIGATAAGAGLLFFGSRMRGSKMQALAAMAVLACTDFYLTVFAYGFKFHVQEYLFTWAWYAAVVLFAAKMLSSKQTMTRVAVAALFSSTGFFLISNAAVWWKSGMYSLNLAGLMESYVAGLPFYRNDFIATLMLSYVLIVLPASLSDAVDGLRESRAFEGGPYYRKFSAERRAYRAALKARGE